MRSNHSTFGLTALACAAVLFVILAAAAFRHVHKAKQFTRRAPIASAPRAQMMAEKAPVASVGTVPHGAPPPPPQTGMNEGSQLGANRAAVPMHNPGVVLSLDQLETVRAMLRGSRGLFPGSLTSVERQTLADFLRAHPGPKGADEGEIHELQNNAMNRLVMAEPPSAAVGEMLAAIYHDRTQNIVTRDYAIQHLGSLYFQNVNSSAPVLWEAVKEIDSSIAGTALLALNRLSQSPGGPDREKVGACAVAMVLDEQCGGQARLTALQVCAQLGRGEALPVARFLARTSTRLPLRAAAVAALGDLGTAEDRVVLERLAGEAGLGPAAQGAMDRMQRRLGSESKGL